MELNCEEDPNTYLFIVVTSNEVENISGGYIKRVHQCSMYGDLERSMLQNLNIRRCVLVKDGIYFPSRLATTYSQGFPCVTQGKYFLPRRKKKKKIQTACKIQFS
jgi:hypothetical protein